MNDVRVGCVPSRTRAGVALTVACASWGLSFPLVKALDAGANSVDPHLDSWFVAGSSLVVRFLVGAVVLALWTRVVPSRKELGQGVALGIVTGLGMLLQTDALAYTNASTGAFLTQGYVILLPLVGIARTRKLPPARVAICALLVLVGLAILARFDPRSLGLGRGETETLSAAACFTVQILLVDAPLFAGNRTAVVTTVMFTTIALSLSPVVAFAARGAGDFALMLAVPDLFAYLAVIICLPTLASFSLMNRFQPFVTASEAGIIYAAEPVFTSAITLFLPGWLSRFSHVDYPNETLGPRLLLGGALVLGANLLLAWRPS